MVSETVVLLPVKMKSPPLKQRELRERLLKISLLLCLDHVIEELNKRNVGLYLSDFGHYFSAKTKCLDPQCPGSG